MKPMTHKERAIAALTRQIPDRVPTFELEYQLAEEMFGKRHRHRLLHGEVRGKIAFVRPADRFFIPQKRPQNGVHKAGRRARYKPDGFIHRRVSRDLIHEQQLIQPEPERIPHKRIKRLYRTACVLPDHVVERNAPFRHAVHEPCIEGAVGGGEIVSVKAGADFKIRILSVAFDGEKRIQRQGADGRFGLICHISNLFHFLVQNTCNMYPEYHFQ